MTSFKVSVVQFLKFVEGDRSMFRWQLVGWIIGVMILCSGCRLSFDRPLPTYAPKAEAPEIPPSLTTTPVPVPATFTVSPDEDQVAGLATREITPTPSPVPPTITPIPSPTPARIGNTVFIPVNAPFLDEPAKITACTNLGTVYRSRFPADYGGPWRYYHIYLPPCYGRDSRAYPVMYLMHGSIQTDTHWLELGLAQYADAGIESGRLPPFIAVMPYNGPLGNQSSGGVKSIEGVTIDHLLPFIDQSYCTWSEAEGRSIGGISRGGYWALEIAFNHPALFSAVSGHSSHLRLETDPARYNPLVTYETADLSVMRIWMDRGEKDFLRPGQNRLHDNLTAAGIPHEYRVNEGGHSDIYWAEHLAEYLDWLTAGWPRDRALYPPCF